MTCLVALVYISLVVLLMIWCRNKRRESRSSDDQEMKEEENNDTPSDVHEKDVSKNNSNQN
jgi:hypothetical protein